MNRRELFKGACAALAAAAIPIPAPLEEELFGVGPSLAALPYLRKLQQELVNKIMNPPMLLDGNIIRPLVLDVQFEALKHVNKLLEEFDGPK